MLKNLTHSKTSYNQNRNALENSKNIDHKSSAFLITSKLFYSAREGEHIINELDRIDKNELEEKLELEIELFRQRFGTTINKDYFEQLNMALEFYKNNLGKGNNPDDILIYHQFLTIFKLTSLALRVVVRLEIPIDSILRDLKDHTNFFNNLKH